MPRLARAALRLSPVLLFALFGLCACAQNTREWRADDHDQEPSSGGGGAAAAQGTVDPGADRTELVDSAWQAKCVKCHGPEGHGDGPSGPMVGAADLWDPKIQDGFTDDQLASIIANGRGRMPAFDDVPPELIQGLVQKVRTFRAR